MNDEMFCGYCGGGAVYRRAALAWEHADAGDRVAPGGPGDFVSAGHNRRGTRINPADLATAEEMTA